MLHFSIALPINFIYPTLHNDNQFPWNYRSIWHRCCMLIRSYTRTLCRRCCRYVLFSTSTRKRMRLTVISVQSSPASVHTHTAAHANVSGHVSSEITSSHIHKELSNNLCTYFPPAPVPTNTLRRSHSHSVVDLHLPVPFYGSSKNSSYNDLNEIGLWTLIYAKEEIFPF